MKTLTTEKNIRADLTAVRHPSRYAGGEWNSMEPDSKTKKISFALAFPDVYEIGMSFLGFKILYEIINRRDDAWAERVFAPWHDREAQLRASRQLLAGLESGRPLKDFSIVGFTLQYEMSYTNIINMLDLGGISPWRRDRSEGDPLIIAGGPCAFNPEPLADFFGLFVFGVGVKMISRVI